MKNSELVVATENIDSETEFIILASTGVWEVSNHIIKYFDPHDPLDQTKISDVRGLENNL